MKTVFEFDDYKAFLRHFEETKGKLMRGFRTRLAEAGGCNNTFVSQVLNGHAHFSLEQSLAIARYLALSQREEGYFLHLVEYRRAGTPALKEHFRQLLEEEKAKFLNLENRIKKEKALGPESQATYYSQWHYAAVHMIVTIPQFRSVSKIARALSLGRELTQQAVGFLLDHGLLVEKDGELLPGPSYLHLDKKSPHIYSHHINWRTVAMQSIQRSLETGVHYSTVSTFSKADAEALRVRLVEVVQEYVEKVSRSRAEEEIYCFNLDFFNLRTE